MRFARPAQVAIIAISLVFGTQAPATQTLYGTHYDETVTKSCFNITYCQVLFSQLPSNKLTQVHRVTCRLTTLSPNPVYDANLQVSATTNGVSLGRYVPLTLNIPVGSPVAGRYNATVNMDPDFLIGQSRYPFVEAYTSANTEIDMECTLSGTLIDPIP